MRVTDPNGKSLLYTYDAQGNLDTVTGATGSVVNMDYDKLGRKIAMRDPDMGNWRYGHNHFGELTSQNDGKNQITTMSYDGLGRMTSRVSNSDSSTWVYDLAVGGKGLLFQEYNYIDGATQPDLVRTYGYDSHSRLSNLSTDIAHEGVFTQRTTFDRYGRTFQQFAATDPIAGEEFKYNAYDYLNQVIEAGNSANTTHVYREIIAMDARGNITEEIKGGIRTTRAYHADTGRIMGISALAGFVQNLGYDFDIAGNLAARTDLKNGNNLSETFTYD